MCADIEQQEMVSLSNIIQCVIHFEKKFSELLLLYVLYNTNNLITPVKLVGINELRKKSIPLLKQTLLKEDTARVNKY